VATAAGDHHAGGQVDELVVLNLKIAIMLMKIVIEHNLNKKDENLSMFGISFGLP
jgi:hypothetical protein